MTTLDDLQDALSFIDADNGRDEWIRILMGIKNEFGEAGFDIAESWSKTGQSYNPEQFKSSWKSIKPSGGITIATVFNQAKENGYSPKNRTLSPEQHAKAQAEYAKKQKAREAQEKKDQANTERWHKIIADAAKTILDNYTIKIKSNAYLTQKKVKAFGVNAMKTGLIVVFSDNFKISYITTGKEINDFFKQLPPNKEDRDYSFLHCKRGDLVIPLIDIEKKLWNLQIINKNCKKMFLKHGRKSGCFHFIGNAKSFNIVGVAEGYATSATIHMATGWPMAMALDNNNLVPVTKSLKAKLPDKTFIVCSDNDEKTKGNPGVKKAKEAAAAVNGLVAIPDLTVCEATSHG